jgi:hypothetical protein
MGLFSALRPYLHEFIGVALIITLMRAGTIAGRYSALFYRRFELSCDRVFKK